MRLPKWFKDSLCGELCREFFVNLCSGFVQKQGPKLRRNSSLPDSEGQSSLELPMTEPTAFFRLAQQ